MTDNEGRWMLSAEATILGKYNTCEAISFEFGSEAAAREAYDELKEREFGFVDPKTVHIVMLESPDGQETILFRLGEAES